MTTAKYKFLEFVFNSANQNFIHFLAELQKLAKDAIAIAAHAIIEKVIYAKKLPLLKKTINQAHLLEKGTYQKIDTRLGTELDLRGLEAADELQT